jgi:hypothetical protein
MFPAPAFAILSKEVDGTRGTVPCKEDFLWGRPWDGSLGFGGARVFLTRGKSAPGMEEAATRTLIELGGRSPVALVWLFDAVLCRLPKSMSCETSSVADSTVEATLTRRRNGAFAAPMLDRAEGPRCSPPSSLIASPPIVLRRSVLDTDLESSASILGAFALRSRSCMPLVSLAGSSTGKPMFD